MSFGFVNYDGPKLPRDKAVRKLIRQSAMKDVAMARRERGNYGQHNLGQYPQLVDRLPPAEAPPVLKATQTGKEGQVRTLGVTSRRRDEATDSKQWNQRLGPSSRRASAPNPYLGSPAATMREDFLFLLNLIPVMGLRLGVATSSQWTPEPARRHVILSTRQLGSSKLLAFIPSRYGQVSSLSHATDCVVAKLRFMVQTPGSKLANAEAAVLLHYSKALRAVQDALDDETQRMKPDTLCATVLLSVFEALHGSPEAHSWIRHVAGAARLIEVRGPQRFNSEFELALFMAHIGPSVMEALLNNTVCFLATKRWQNVMHSAICSDKSFDDQRELVLNLWRALVRAPELFKDTTDIILSPTLSPQSTIDALIGRLLKAHEGLAAWLNQALESTKDGESGAHGECLTIPKQTIRNDKTSRQYITQLALRGTYVMCSILKSRLLVALAPARFHYLEVECQDLAAKIMCLGENWTRDDGGRVIWDLFMYQSIWIAKGVIKTKDIWHQGWEEQKGTIEKQKFTAWCKAIGRKATLEEKKT